MAEQPFVQPAALVRHDGAFAVGADEVLVINLGPRATMKDADDALRKAVGLLPQLKGRALIVSAESMAKVKAEAS